MTLSYTQIVETFDDGTGSPTASGTAQFTVNTTIYASGIPILQPDVPIKAVIINGQLRSPSAGALQLLDLASTSLSMISQTGFWFWTVAITIGIQELEPWSFFLEHSDGPVDLYSLANTQQSTFPNPMTTLGDLIVGAASGAPTRLAGNTSSAREFLISQGTGTAAQAEAWGPLEASDIPVTSVEPGSYTNADITVGADGRIIAASDGAGGGSGTVTSASVASANGFAGTVANPTTTPAITVKTTVTGLLKGNGTAVSAAAAGTDYLAPANNLSDVADPATAWQNLAGSHLGKMTGWFAALADRDAARASVAVIGASSAAGQHASSFANSHVERMNTRLRNRFPNTVTGTGGGRGFLVPITSATSFSATWCTVTGSPTVLANQGVALQGFDISAGGGCSLAYSLFGDSADIIWCGGSGHGSFTWAVDGGGTTAVSTATGSTTDGQVTHVSLGAAGAHTLTIAWSSGSNVWVDGVVEYNGDYAAGIQVHSCGLYAATITQMASSLYAQAIAALQPSLIVIEAGANGVPGITAPQWGTDLAAIITAHRAAYATPPPFLLAAHYNEYGNDGISSAAWQAWVQATYAVANADPFVDIYDMSLRMPGTDQTQLYGLYYSDLIHMNDEGHSYLADSLVQFLSPE